MTNKKKRNSRSESTTDQETNQRDDKIELMGIVEDAMPGTLFKVKCENSHTVLCTLSGKLRMNKIRILVGDQVKVEVSPYDTSRGRVVWRGK